MTRKCYDPRHAIPCEAEACPACIEECDPKYFKEEKTFKSKMLSKQEQSIAKGRMALFVMQTNVNEKGEFNALIAVEGEKGYYKTDWYWGKDFAVAEQIADERNAEAGLSKEDAWKIIASTMRK